jgi:hypothetical protein
MIVIILQAAEAYLHESKDALENAEGMFYSGPHSSFGPVLRARDLVDALLVPRAS